MDSVPHGPLTRDEALALMTCAESPLAVSKAVIGDVEYDVFTHAPNNLRDLFNLSNEHFKEREFLIFEEERLTYGEVHKKSVALAHSLFKLGVEPGDRVAISMRNYPEYAIALEAILAVGAVAVTLNAWWLPEEIEYGLIDSGARFAFVDHERWDRFTASKNMLDLGAAITRPRGELPSDVLAMADLMKSSQEESFPPLDIDTDSDALIMYTSGSTDHPKGVVLTHRGIISALLNFFCIGVIAALTGPEAEFRQLVQNWLKGGTASMNDPLSAKLPAEKMLVNVPFFHVSGLHTMLLFSFLTGRNLYLMYKWNAEEALALAEKEKLTTIHGVPTMIGEILHSADLEKRDLSSVISVSGGGAARPPEHVKLIRNKLPHVVPGVGYGMTETNAAGATISGEEYIQRPSSTGRASAPLIDIKIRDEHGRNLGTNEEGEICMKSSLNMRCYWNKPEETHETLREGWIYSGDLGYLDEEDYLFITGRAKDIIIRGGENIACGEIENVLHEHPAVNEAAVLGAPDERLGEIVCATVYLRTGCTATVEEIQKHVGSHLASFKVPSHVHFAAERLPRIASGKFDKITLKKQTIERLEKMGSGNEWV